ncbi:MAG: LuxR C-terminal-related transcriptional regulator [Bacillota bacterium]|nr:LuxR C-terminal-related transcriptional regulator [Bacillota bacterium]MDW7678800.1 LuxR C-terminal-related transcriptional regulator [Bacillota bacterium]
MRATILEKIYQPKNLTILSAVFFFGWILVMPFEGKILRVLFEQKGIVESSVGLAAMMAHLLGLVVCAIFLRNSQRARQVMLAAILFCVVGSVALLTRDPRIWYWAAMGMAFFSGLYVAAWGYFLRDHIPSKQRLTAVADVLIGSNLIMIFIDVFTVNWDVRSGELLALVVLLFALLAVLRLEPGPAIYIPQTDTVPGSAEDAANEPYLQRTLVRPFFWLCVFIAFITLNSGLMYQVVVPAFAPFTFLFSFYWAMPYVVALLILRNLPQQVNRAFTLYLALAMMGLGYLLFIRLSVTAGSFLLINTLMLFALGVFDLFWWSLLASFLDYAHRPAVIVGLGLSANVLGILLGGITGIDMMVGSGAPGEVPLTAFTVIFLSLAVLPLLNIELSRLFKHHIFLVSAAPNEIRYESDSTPRTPEQMIPDSLEIIREKHQLTDREMEIIALLNRGYTYRAIAETLGITENTIKFHAKNIYQKLQVNNKMELIKVINSLFEEMPAD